MISTFVDELIKLITEIDLFVMSAVKYLMSYSFLNTILAKGLGTGTLRYLEINLFPVNMSVHITWICNKSMPIATVLLRSYS